MGRFIFAVLLGFTPFFVQVQLSAAQAAPLQSSKAANGTVSIPDTACEESTLAGTTTASGGHPIQLAVAPAIAAKLSFYYGLNLFVLAPRGWTCAVNAGSTGGSLTNLVVMPPGGNSWTGPIVSLSNTSSDDNGSFIVNSFGGRYFPKIFTPKDVASALQIYNVTKTQFLAARYSSDRLASVNNSVLQYLTPPYQMGLGPIILRGGEPSNVPPDPDLPKYVSKLSTQGMISIFKLANYPGSTYYPDTYIINLLAIRLPPDLASLYSAILSFSVHCQPFDLRASCADQVSFVNNSQ